MNPNGEKSHSFELRVARRLVKGLLVVVLLVRWKMSGRRKVLLKVIILGDSG